LNEKLKFLKEWNLNRNEIATFYSENLSHKYILPKVNSGNYHVWHLYVIRTKKRNQLIDEGKKHNIEFGIHYPRPVHRQKAYSDLKVKKLVNSEKQANELLSLPMFPKMKKNEMQKVVSFLDNF
jgi:dTDP-4-amino-4,6-dideoxygalactose transaminase